MPPPVLRVVERQRVVGHRPVVVGREHAVAAGADTGERVLARHAQRDGPVAAAIPQKHEPGTSGWNVERAPNRTRGAGDEQHATTAIAPAIHTPTPVKTPGADRRSRHRPMNNAPVPTRPHTNAAVRDPDSHMPAKFTAKTAMATAGRCGASVRIPRKPIGAASAAHIPYALASSIVPVARSSDAQNCVTQQTDIDRSLQDGDDARRRRARPEAVQHDWRLHQRGLLPRPFEPQRADQLCEHDVERPRCGIRRRHQRPGVDRSGIEEAGEAEADLARDEHGPRQRQCERPAANQHVPGKRHRPS